MFVPIIYKLKFMATIFSTYVCYFQARTRVVDQSNLRCYYYRNSLITIISKNGLIYNSGSGLKMTYCIYVETSHREL